MVSERKPEPPPSRDSTCKGGRQQHYKQPSALPAPPMGGEPHDDGGLARPTIAVSTQHGWRCGDHIRLTDSKAALEHSLVQQIEVEGVRIVKGVEVHEVWQVTPLPVGARGV